MPKSLFDACVAGAARAFYPSHFANADERARAVRSAARPLASEVARALTAQNARYAASAAREANLQALREGAAVVVTGQQVGLFLGPLYTLYKAATAIVAARALEAETGTRVVPVFWLQTEDHDLVEIACVHAPSAAGDVLELKLDVAKDNHVSVAHCALPDDVQRCVQQLLQELAHFPNAAPHLERVQRHFKPGTTFAGAFAGMLAELFADEGLVLLDPRDPALAAQVAAVHRRAITEHTALARALSEQSEALTRAGFAAGVHVRPDATLSFFHAHGASSGRARLHVQGTQFVGADAAAYSQAELLAALARDPLSFSTSALLRPIVQDTLLPTAMYVGGPAEVAYFAQLPPLYAAFGMQVPMVLPRARFRVVDEKTRRVLERLGVTASDAARSEDELLALVSAHDAGLPASAELERALGDALCATLDRELQRLQPLAPEVAASAEKTRATLRASVEKLVHKHTRARARADEARVADVRRVQRALQPNGQPQERCYGASHFLARYGEQAFLQLVLEHVRPFEVALRELQP